MSTKVLPLTQREQAWINSMHYELVEYTDTHVLLCSTNKKKPPFAVFARRGLYLQFVANYPHKTAALIAWEALA